MIRVDSVTKRYGDHVAVDQVTFECKPGLVTGFLGPNGAGKSTTMRMMVGLTPITQGTITIGGHRYRDIPNPGRHVGVLLDASAQHAGRTGLEVLTLAARTMDLPTSRVAEILELVSLTPAEAKRRVGNYSLGMRQRLGIGVALLGDPQVLILDEPANGLDPAGIRWMRGLLKGYADRGGAVVLSSHLLHEVEQIADEIVVIGQGRIVAQGTKQQLLAQAGGTGTVVAGEDRTALEGVLRTSGWDVVPLGEGFRVAAQPVQVGRLAAQHQVVLVDLRAADGGLENLFFELTSDTQRETYEQGAPA